jgi:signal transduction histidine kinase
MLPCDLSSMFALLISVATCFKSSRRLKFIYSIKCQFCKLCALPYMSIPSASKFTFNNPVFRDVSYTILFGSLSWLLSLVGVDQMNLREVPLLICLIHIQRLRYVFALCFFTLLNHPAGIPLWVVYGVHLVPLIIAWLSFQLVEKRKLPNIFLGLSSVIITLVYYLFALLPLVVFAVTTFTNNEKSFSTSYFAILPLSSFEIVSSALVVSFYLMQFAIRKTLEHSNENLSLEVEKRTIELTHANNELISLNEELKSSNESIKELNENLEQMVKQRTDKINDQLKQLSKYAHMNSHEVRAPLARMLGLMQLINHKDVPTDQKTNLIEMLYDSSNELDTVIKEMNRLLEKEINL